MPDRDDSQEKKPPKKAPPKRKSRKAAADRTQNQAVDKLVEVEKQRVVRVQLTSDEMRKLATLPQLFRARRTVKAGRELIEFMVTIAEKLDGLEEVETFTTRVRVDQTFPVNEQVDTSPKDAAFTSAAEAGAA